LTILPIPEPSTGLLLLVGLVAFRRRGKRHTNWLRSMASDSLSSITPLTNVTIIQSEINQQHSSGKEVDMNSQTALEALEETYVIRARQDTERTRPPRRESPRFASRRGGNAVGSGIHRRGNKRFGL